MEQVQQVQGAQVQEPQQPIQAEPQQPQQQTGGQTEPQGNVTLTAEDFAAMSDEDKARVLAQIEAAQTGGQSEPQRQPEPEPQSNVYSLDEFNAIDLASQAIDPSRLPQTERDIHAKYMDFYNKSILPQLQELQRIKAAQQPQAQQQPQPTFNDVVAARAMQNLGVNQLDMRDPRTALEISKQSNLLAQELQQMQYWEAQQKQQAQATQQIFAQVRNEIKNYDTLDRWAKDELVNLPLKTANQIMTDLRSGDYGKVKAVYDFFAQRYAQQNGGEPTQSTDNMPPSVIGGSMQEAPAKPFSYDGFAKADEDEQKDMLIRAGLI